MATLSQLWGSSPAAKCKEEPAADMEVIQVACVDVHTKRAYSLEVGPCDTVLSFKKILADDFGEQDLPKIFFHI